MIIRNNSDGHLVLFPSKITKEKFLQKAKVKKESYFYKRIESIYMALSSSTTNVEDEYRNYYGEYNSFYDFLYHKYPFLNEEILTLIIEKIDTKMYILLRGHMGQLVDYNLHMLIDNSEEFTDKINTLLKAEYYEN